MRTNYELIYKIIRLHVIIVMMITMLNHISGCTSDNIISKNQNSPPTKIALLLPLNSKSVRTNNLAKSLINSARLAAQDLSHLNLSLTVYPTSGETKTAVLAAEAALAGGAEIIVGPLFSHETTAVKTALKNNDIKIISLSNDPFVAGNNVFIMGTTFKTSANTLVKFALSRGLQRIAIIGPEGQIGLNGIRAARNAITDNGAILTTISLYPLSPMGIRNAAPNIFQELVSSASEAAVF